MNFCTKFDHRYLDRGLVLYQSIQLWAPESWFNVLALSEECADFLEKLGLPYVRVIRTDDLCRLDPRLAAAKADRNAASFVFTQTPFLVLAALNNVTEGEHMVYIDADTCFFSSPAGVVKSGGEYDVTLTRHNFAPHWQPMDLFGEFNTGWVGFRRTPAAQSCAEWWAERCLEWCHDRPENGKFGDQKYLEGLQSLGAKVHVLSELGVNCAPWNASGRSFTAVDGKTYVDGTDLVHFHFSLLEKINPFCVAPRLRQQLVRHTQGIKRYVYSPYSRFLRSASTRFGIPREFLRPREHSSRDLHAGFHSRDTQPAWWRVGWRILKGEYVIG
jgi:hypothetical protein